MGITSLFDWGEANALFFLEKFTLINKARSRIKVFDMINSITIRLLLLGSLVAYERLKRKKRGFHAPPTNQLPS